MVPRGLDDAIAKLGAELHAQYVLSFVPEASASGYHNLETLWRQGGIIIQRRSWNPYDSSDIPRYIEANQQAGINFLGPNTSPRYPLAAQGVTLDNVLVSNNASWGVLLDGVSNDTVNTNPVFGGFYVGYINNACLIANTPNTSPTSWTTLFNPLPVNPALYRNGAPGVGPMTSCPPTSWPVPPRPARSYTLGWSW